QQLQLELANAVDNPTIRIIQIKANGKHFSTGADINWMQQSIRHSEAENITDAMCLADVLYTLYTSPKPIVTVVHGSAFGGGAGLIAASDIVIAGTSAKFCFPEAKLGIIPAIISPYVILAIGSRNAKWLFLTAEVFDASKANDIGLVHHCVPDVDLHDFAASYIQKMLVCAPGSMAACKTLVDDISGKPLSRQLLHQTATLIAKKRISREGQLGLRAFLNKETPDWN
ncbi:MAG: gamma-carboxygeranoyl-CoA hydratase, partial [Legionellales bacterium RIFCSPHIGHO2_12_FULL_42_9]